MFKNKIPDIGMSENDLFEDLENSKNSDLDWKSGKTFGAVYYPGESYSKAISSAYVKFMHENAFDPQLFNSILNMENELVQQTASLFSSNLANALTASSSRPSKRAACAVSKFVSPVSSGINLVALCA